MQMRQTLEERLAVAEEMKKAAEQERLEKEELTRSALAEQEAIMEKVVQESKLLEKEAEENSKVPTLICIIRKLPFIDDHINDKKDLI